MTLAVRISYGQCGAECQNRRWRQRWVQVLPGQMVSVTSAMLPHPHENLNSGEFLMAFEMWLPPPTQSPIHQIWTRNTTAHRFVRTAHASHTHGDPGPLTFNRCRKLTVTRNIGNDTRFQAGSKSFGPSIAFTMRHEALEWVINALSQLLYTGAPSTDTMAPQYSSIQT